MGLTASCSPCWSIRTRTGFVIQLDEPEDGPSFEVAEARAGHVVLSIERGGGDGPLAEVRQLPRGRVVDVSAPADDSGE